MRKVLYLLGQLNDDDIEWMLGVGARRRLPIQTTLIREGQPIDALYVLLDGVLSIQVAALGNQEIARLGVGEIIGEMSFVDARPPSATVMTLGDTLVFEIGRTQLHARLERDAPFAARFYRALAVFLADRLRNTVGQLGYGTAREDNRADPDELDEGLLDTVHLAGARFERILKRLMGQERV
jgi:CRP-like cAMP-binding protein